MFTSNSTILAIDPSARAFGFAVLSAQGLRYFGVKTVRQRQAPHTVLQEIARLIEKFIAEYQPTVLAIKKTSFRQPNTALLNVAVAELKALARQHSLRVCEYWPLEIQQYVCQKTKTTKTETAQAVVKKYPELARYLKSPTKWEVRYWGKMFDAVAVGMYCWEGICEESQLTQTASS